MLTGLWYLHVAVHEGLRWVRLDGQINCCLQLAADTVVNVWKNYGIRKADAEMQFVTQKGYKAITSACWYLNILSYGEDWHKYYQCDPMVCFANVLSLCLLTLESDSLTQVGTTYVKYHCYDYFDYDTLALSI